MHLGNGAITPECGLVALGIAALGVGVAAVAARSGGLDRGRARTAGALGAAVFAAQLFNVPILPFGSVHLIGGVLLAWVLGPALGAISMASILSLQAVLLGDGGLLALGVNIINMSLLPAAAVAVVKRSAADSSWNLAATALACTVGAAGLIVLELAIGRASEQLEGLGPFAARMVGWHVLAGMLEAAASVAIVAMLARVAERDAAGFRLSSRGAAALSSRSTVVLSSRGAAVVTAVSLLVAALPALGLASSLPDGYQAALAVARQSGLAVGQIDAGGQLAGLSATAQNWQDRLAAAFPGPEVVLVVLATALAGLMAWGYARMISPPAGVSIQ